jgi:opacity protein-like surface antigen
MKKLLVVSAIAALGLSSVAFAGGLPETMPAAPAAVSSDTGIYVGLSAGYGINNWKNLDGLNSISVGKDNGVVGRFFVGYDINRYFAAELGYTRFFNKPTFSFNREYNKVKSTQVFDLMGKIKAPVVDNFDLYAKLGVGYMMTNFDTNTPLVSDTGTTKKNRRAFNVAFGVGADYYITPNIIANIEWLRFNGYPKHNAGGGVFEDKYQPYSDAFLVGLRYRFDI